MPGEHLQRFLSRRRRLLAALSVVACAAVLPAQQTLAQAGSRPAQYFDSPQTFYHSLNGSAPGMSSARAIEPLAPVGLLALAPTARYLFWVELEQGRLNVMENLGDAGIVVRKRIPVSIGKQGIGKRSEGDNKTPIGVYRLREFLADGVLDDFYGLGAWPLDYPNALDQLHARTGHGIWLHGLPKVEKQRPFLASEGCVIIDNDSLVALSDEIEGGVMMVLSPRELRWVPLRQQHQQGRTLQQAMQEWESAWESRDTDRYLAFYSDDFSDLRRDKAEWSDYKREVNAGKRSIEVEVSEVNMVVEPGQQEVVNVTFRQHYDSDNYRWQGSKQQLWRWEAGGWKIIYEGNY